MTTLPVEDGRWLDSLVRLARSYRGTTKGRPLAAALVVDLAVGIVLGRSISGSAAPEAAALAEAGEAARGQCLYVTLEPDPAVVVAADVRRVVVGAEYPGQRQRGGIARMREAGIEVVLIEDSGCLELLEGPRKVAARGRPFVTLRLAVSRDGMIGRRDGAPVQIMGEEAKRWTALQRAFSDGVLIGARTTELDDPRLEVGHSGFEDHPYARIVVVGSRPLPERLNLLGEVSGHPTYVIAEEERALELPPFIEVLRVPGRNGRPDLRQGFAMLAERNIGTLLVEGGAKLTEALFGAELVDRIYLIQGTIEIGRDGLPATPLGGIEGRLHAAGMVEKERRFLGVDLLRTFEPQF